MDNISQVVESIQKHHPDIEYKLNEPLKNHTSFKIGGPVRVMCFPAHTGDIINICEILKKYDLTPFIIGNGTNLLAGDSIHEMDVISTVKMQGIEKTGETEITADAGVMLSKLAVYAYEREFSGLEFAHGIPGTLGGAVVMNAGAYGGEMKDMIRSSAIYIREKGIVDIPNQQHGFSYRQSRFSNSDDIVLSSEICLQRADKKIIKTKMDELAVRRRESQPLDMPSAGSVFKRPPDGFAAAYIDQARLKGFKIGGAQVSEKHAGFIVNKGSATFSDVMAVIDHVRETVFRQFNVDLEPEIKIIKTEA